MTALCDQHSVEYEFEDLTPIIGGVTLDAIMFSGKAELANDPPFLYRVASITLTGTVKDLASKPSLFFGRARKPAAITLLPPAKTDTTHEAMIFRLIEAAIENDPRAADRWRTEMEAA